jgi:hypothetical protein
MPAHRRAPASQRQIDIMLELWPTDATIPVIAGRLTDGRTAGEPHFDKNGVNRLRLQLGLPNRHKPKYDDPRGCAWKSYETYPDGTPHPHAVLPNASPVTSFREIWNSINDAGAWEANPWVVAYSFTVALGNIDSLPVAA